MTVTIEVKATSGKANELYQTLQALISALRKEKRGCRVCHVSVGPNKKDVFTLTCDWEEPDNFKSYVCSDSGAALMGALELLGESVRLSMGSERWAGIEVLRKMRNA